MADAGDKKTEHVLSLVESKLDKIYSQAIQEVGEKLDVYMEKHMSKYDKMWSKYEKGEITFEQFEQWAKGGITGQKYQQLLEALSEDCTHTNQIAMNIVNGYIPDVYALNRNYGMYQLDVGGGVNLEATFSLYDRKTVERLARGKASLLPKPKVDIPKDKQWNKKHIRNAITQGILQGESIPKVAKRLQKVVVMNRSSAIRNARTAITGAQNAGRIDSYKDAKKRLGINVMKEWQASGDGLTRESHAEISGERIKMNEVFSNGCEYPGDPGGPPEEVYNCRCTLLPYLPDYDFKEDRVEDEGGFDDWLEYNQDDEKKRLDEAVSNAKEFSPEEHSEMNFSNDFWMNDLNEEERNAIYAYTGSSYSKMNNVLRGRGRYPDDHMVDLIKNCEKGLAKSQVAEDTILYRGMGSENTLSRALGVSVDDIDRIVRDHSIVGMRFVEQGFCSTGVISSSGWDKEVVMEIVAPKGTTGMYVDPISRYQGENELLLQRGTIFEILEASPATEDDRSDMVYKLKVVVCGLDDSPLPF